MLINPAYAIYKFGGSSLADAKRFTAVKSLLQGNEIIVVSAIYGTTSLLQLLLDAAKNHLQYQHYLTEIKDKHLSIIQELALSHLHIGNIIKEDIQKINDILYAIQLAGSYSKEVQNLILGYGELWSAMILKEYLSKENKVAFLDAAKVLFIQEKNGLIEIDWQTSKAALKEFLQGEIFNQLVITGFIASTLDGQRTTLGRNGSDFSAAIFANLFNAQSLTIWTDVDGIYTADPNLVRSAFVIESLSYQEALELAYFGAKVLHPMAIAPVVKDKIPIYIKNSFNPSGKYTCISAQPKESQALIKGISCIKEIGLFNIEGGGYLNSSNLIARVFSILYYANINVLFLTQASSEHSMCFAVAADSVARTKEALFENLKNEIKSNYIKTITLDENCSILSIVGDKMIGAIGIANKLCKALAKVNINIRAISQGSSERNITLIVKKKDAVKAMQAIHSGFYLSRKSLAIGLIGPGLVGQSLLKQFTDTLTDLKCTYQINLTVRAIINSKKMLLLNNAEAFKDWKPNFNAYAIDADLEKFVAHLTADNIPNVVIIDCTASPQVASLYQRFMAKGIHIITPNKYANAGDLSYYQKLQALARKNLFYLYEATVCAGLPVISTLQDIIKTGDQVERIEGVFSGTLSYIFNALKEDKTFSEAVLQAKLLGYTEPDPREDLSGMDVARKLVCLAREIGHNITINDVIVSDLVPPELKLVSLDEFLNKLPAYDQSLTHRLAAAKANNQHLCYVGSITKEGKLKVAIEAFAKDHPFAKLKGTDNIIMFHTKRYSTHPLIIQGPGAGAEVTAAGIFSDLLRLVASL
ncbi:bifunctional aspartate kinase/homoserine dehydrogenase I [Legionella sp. D16C41]|uniref:bifunctional aspartate kinase/homoserine dehydrogenase I n=1 Tax=Legionella sp. D16C41 TaxID=3402688 RepID=UPI003AF4503C